MSSMIHSARPTVTPVAITTFCCFVLLDLKDGRTDGQHVQKVMITTAGIVGRPSRVDQCKITDSSLEKRIVIDPPGPMFQLVFITGRMDGRTYGHRTRCMKLMTTYRPGPGRSTTIIS